MTGNRRSFACDVRARTGDVRLGVRRFLAVQDLLVTLRITGRTRVGSWESLTGLSLLLLLLLLLVESMDNDGKFVDGDVSAGVRNGVKGSRVTVWLQIGVGEVDGDTRGRVNVWWWCGVGGRGGATVDRTRGQTEERRGEVGVGEWRGSGERLIHGKGNGSRNMFCTDGVTTE